MDKGEAERLLVSHHHPQAFYIQVSEYIEFCLIILSLNFFFIMIVNCFSVVVIANIILQDLGNYHHHHHTYGGLHFTKIVSIRSPISLTFVLQCGSSLWDVERVCNNDRINAMRLPRLGYKSKYRFCLVFLGHHV